MRSQDDSPAGSKFARMFGWPRLAVALAGTLVLGSVLLPLWVGDPFWVIAEMLAVGILALVVFGVLESWPRRLPTWLPRWLLQLSGLVLAIPSLLWTIYVAITPPGEPYFWYVHSR